MPENSFHIIFAERRHAQLAAIGLIWVVGSNAFLLRRALKQSGLDEDLLWRKGDDSLVYGDNSAGAIVVTPTLAGMEFVDPPDVLARGDNPAMVWDGLGLVSYSIAPPYKSDHPDAQRIDRTVQHFIDHKILEMKAKSEMRSRRIAGRVRNPSASDARHKRSARHKTCPNDDLIQRREQRASAPAALPCPQRPD